MWELYIIPELAYGDRGSGTISRRRDCHFADALSIPIETTTNGREGCSRMTVSPTARRHPGAGGVGF